MLPYLIFEFLGIANIDISTLCTDTECCSAKR